MLSSRTSRSTLFTAATLVILCLTLSLAGLAQSGNAAALSGLVTDPTGAVVPGATVQIQNPVSGFTRTLTTDATGRFALATLPFNHYHVSVQAPGFTATTRDLDAHSAVPLTLNIALTLAASSQTVTVEASSEDLLENSTNFHTDVDRGLFNKIPLESSSSSVSSLVTLTTPGISADSNGLFHGMGDHASNSFSVDGQPITDQQSKVFSNQIPLDSIQSMEVIDGAPTAEYGGKTSLVIDVTTRSGQGMTTPHGSLTAEYGSFGDTSVDYNVGYGTQKWGNFVSLSGLDSGRFLDAPEFAVMHDHGNQQSLFDRIDAQLSPQDSLHVNLQYTRSWFQTPNSYDQQNATAWNGLLANNGGLGPDGSPVGAADQRSKILTFNIAPTWTHVLNSSSLLTAGAFVRRDDYKYFPSNNPFADLSANLQTESIAQHRTLTNAGLRLTYAYNQGIHNLKAGVTYQHTFLGEHDSLGIVDPTFNDPTSANYNAALAAYDLTRGGQRYQFRGSGDIKETALYLQDAITAGAWNFNLGLRGDIYRGLSSHSELQPRLGTAYNIHATGTSLRLSYARTMETPFNENLVLSSTGCANAVLNSLLGCSSSSSTPLEPGWRNEFHAGLSQALGRYVVVSGEYVWKYTHHGYDFSVLGNTPITFPIAWQRSKIPGFVGRINLTNFHGLTAQMNFSSVAARFFEPQVGGAGATPTVAGGVFRIDHDEKYNQTVHVQYQPTPRWPWVGFNWRYDSGQTASSAPYATSANGTVDLSNLTPDQEYQGGLYCGAQHATPTSGFSSCPAAQFGSTLLKIPAAGTENDDKNPPRMRARNLFDFSLGDDDLFHGTRYKWSAQLTVVNLTNERALYNYLSTFSGTHYVTPRSYTAQLGFHF